MKMICGVVLLVGLAFPAIAQQLPPEPVSDCSKFNQPGSVPCKSGNNNVYPAVQIPTNYTTNMPMCSVLPEPRTRACRTDNNDLVIIPRSVDDDARFRIQQLQQQQMQAQIAEAQRRNQEGYQQGYAIGSAAGTLIGNIVARHRFKNFCKKNPDGWWIYQGVTYYCNP